MNFSKLSSFTKQLIDTADMESERELDLLIRMDAAMSPEQAEAAIREVGGRIRTQAGDILTLSLPLRSLDALSRLDSVLYVEASEPLYPESPPDDTGE